MKKFIGLFLSVIIIVIVLSGCNNVQKDQNYEDNTTDYSFTLIESGSRLSLYKENRTDVMYVVYHSGYKGGLTVMLDNDGKPLTYANWKK